VRREPEKTVLYHVLASHLETFLARVASDPDRGDLPRFVVRELRGFLDCGLLERGFCRVHCTACGRDDLVAFSCKRRGFCPSCGTRRMIDTAAHLVDRVLPDAPVRQWVLALPHRVRFLCAFDPELCAGVRRILVRAISSFYRSRAKRRGVPDPRTGCVVFIQRFDSALRLNVHFHLLSLDGTFSRSGDGYPPTVDFHDADTPTDDEIERLARTLRDRVLRFCRKRGVIPAEDPTTADAEEPSPLTTLAGAAVQGMIAFGPHAGAHSPRLGRGSETGGEYRRGKLCADCDGFSLHAGVRIPECCPERLEKLCRYAARPPVVHQRLSLSKDGSTVIYKLKRKFRDGSTHVLLDPLDFIGRLAALVPRPRVHLTTYHGVLAPASSFRSQVVPPPPPDEPTTTDRCDHNERDPAGTPTPSVETPATPRRRYSWAELMRRVWKVDVLVCSHCAGTRRVLDFVGHPPVVERILRHLGMLTAAPAIAAARPPPSDNLPFDF